MEYVLNMIFSPQSNQVIITSLLTALSTSAIFIYILKTVFPALVKSTVKSWFDKQLENHKHELSKLLEGTKFNFTRLTHDYSTFNQKRHETYAELYKLLLIAEGNLSRYGIRLITLSKYDHFSETGLRKYLDENLKLPDTVVDRICAMWAHDREGAHKTIYEWQDRIHLSNTSKSVQQFHNEYLSMELYLSIEVAKALSKIDQAINEGGVRAESHVEAYLDSGSLVPQELIIWRLEIQEKMNQSLENISCLKEEVKSLMLKEIQQGLTDIPLDPNVR
jgi:hypothetical protein